MTLQELATTIKLNDATYKLRIFQRENFDGKGGAIVYPLEGNKQTYNLPYVYPRCNYRNFYAHSYLVPTKMELCDGFLTTQKLVLEYDGAIHVDGLEYLFLRGNFTGYSLKISGGNLYSGPAYSVLRKDLDPEVLIQYESVIALAETLTGKTLVHRKKNIEDELSQLLLQNNRNYELATDFESLRSNYKQILLDLIKKEQEIENAKPIDKVPGRSLIELIKNFI